MAQELLLWLAYKFYEALGARLLISSCSTKRGVIHAGRPGLDEIKKSFATTKILGLTLSEANERC